MPVIPAQAGIQSLQARIAVIPLDPRLRGDDGGIILCEDGIKLFALSIILFAFLFAFFK